MNESSKLYQLGRESFDKGDFDKAIELFSLSNNLYEHFKIFELLGEANIKIGNLYSAVEPLTKATQLNKSVRAPSLLSKVFLDLCDMNNAKKYAKVAIERDKTNKLAIFVLENINENYQPPQSLKELLHRYTIGERNFPNTSLPNEDFSDILLDGASFQNFSCFFDSSFDGASLRGTNFSNCNVKCTSFRNADLTGASFELAAIESIAFEGAILDEVSFVGATCYGYTIKKDDECPPI